MMEFSRLFGGGILPFGWWWNSPVCLVVEFSCLLVVEFSCLFGDGILPFVWWWNSPVCLVVEFSCLVGGGILPFGW